ncbi:hypothetical protein FNH22_03505 [Fulvivirga sp. M361]|uniref:hypothetical protein n=1 Tax=Fulvivirga sp. M361 TaxID=2594266 RepID=UPI00117BACB8|nr:hypothetical protein [Fulvivirga sp. M361]TRX61854.1 hypothetical protein FNH22_03505 [Fulvivirga sp. M361]
MSYFEADYRSAHKDDQRVPCGNEELYESYDRAIHNGRILNTTFQKRTVGRQFKKYRLALLVKANYTNERGRGSVDKAFDEILTIVDRLTGIYEPSWPLLLSW